MAPKLTFFIPTLHKLSNPTAPSSSTRICTSAVRHSVSSSTPRRAPLAIVAPSRPSTSSSRPSTSSPRTAPIPQTKTPRRAAGHKHTAESKRKISIANRGNVPWNKGRRHTEETKRKIAEATKRAMLQPEMRDLLRTRARGRKHTEATRLKIRETALASRGGGRERRKRRSVPFVFSKEVVRELNARVQEQLEKSFTVGNGKLVPREKRPMSMETRDKLSKRIKEMWGDPAYRDKVMRGVESRAKRLREEKQGQGSSAEASSAEVSSADESEGDSIRSAVRENRGQSRNRNRRSERDILEGLAATDAGSSDPLFTNLSDDDLGGLHNAEAKTKKTKSSKRGRPKNSQDDDDVEIVLDADSLQGLTKEDLGIFGNHSAGPIQLGAPSSPAFAHGGNPEELPLIPPSPLADLDVISPINDSPSTLGDFDLPDFNFDIYAEPDMDLSLK